MSFQTDDGHTFRVVGFRGINELRHLMGRAGPEEDILAVNLERSEVEQVLERVRQAEGAALDFDGTVHAGQTFGATRALMSKVDMDADLAELRQYLAGEFDSPEALEDWIFRTVDRLAAAKVDKISFQQLVKDFTPRLGLETFLRTFLTQDASEEPVMFASYGLLDAIEMWAWHFFTPEDYRRLSIRALSLSWNGLDEISGYWPRTVVHDFNKGDVLAFWAQKQQIPLPRVLSVGDSPKTDLGLFRAAGTSFLLVPNVAKTLARLGDGRDRLEARLHDASRQGSDLERALPHLSGVLLGERGFQLLHLIRSGRLTA